MPRDYKNITAAKKTAAGLWSNPLLAFVSGAALGLLIALLVFLYYQNYVAQKPAPAKTPAEDVKPVIEEAVSPKPTFDFYKILPDRKVNISEWVAEEQDKEIPAMNGESVYVLQVGSFKQYSAADRTRGQLALLGSASEIQRVVINGQDVRYRVRIGPYKNPAQLKEARQRLRENNLDSMILKLKLDENAAP